MNALEKKRLEYHAKIRELGSRIRVQGLDQEASTPEHDAAAEALMKDNSEEEVNEALGFAGYLATMADPNCVICGGLGAVAKVALVVGSRAAEAHEPCSCSREGEERRRAAERAVAPTVRVKTTREADLDKRIAEAQKVLADALGRRDAAVAPVVAEADVLIEKVKAHKETRAGLETNIKAAADEARDDQREVDDRREHLRAAEARLRDAQTWHARCQEVLAIFDVEHVPLTEQMVAFEAKRSRIAGHHAPKIEKAERVLRRLKYLRGRKDRGRRTGDLQVKKLLLHCKFCLALNRTVAATHGNVLVDGQRADLCEDHYRKTKNKGRLPLDIVLPRSGRGGMIHDLTGTRFGLLVAISPVGLSEGGMKWLCCCDCGTKHTVVAKLLRRGSVRSCGCLTRRTSDNERFWSRVEKTDRCWLWTGETAKGYGIFVLVGGERVAAHRYSYRLTNGELGVFCVLHRCDNPPCVRPDHLFLGTQADNVHDAIKKGRAYLGFAVDVPIGELHPRAKLSNDEVREMRRLYRTSSMTIGQLANKYDVTDWHVRGIMRGKSRKESL